MNYSVDTTPQFDKQAKRLVKKFPSLKNELAKIIEALSKEPAQGISLGNNFFKIRISIASKGKGKSGGARMITYVKLSATKVFLTAIFDKSERNSISAKELEIIFKSLG